MSLFSGDFVFCTAKILAAKSLTFSLQFRHVFITCNAENVPAFRMKNFRASAPIIGSGWVSTRALPICRQGWYLATLRHCSEDFLAVHTSTSSNWSSLPCSLLDSSLVEDSSSVAPNRATSAFLLRCAFNEFLCLGLRLFGVPGWAATPRVAALTIINNRACFGFVDRYSLLDVRIKFASASTRISNDLRQA